MTEAEYLLPRRQRKDESVLSLPVNGEERVISSLSTEKTQKTTSFSVNSDQPPSPSMSHNGYEPHFIKNSAALPANKNKACKKKKKCLSDIFGHIVGGSSVITKVVDQLHTTTHALKKEPEDSPYADLDSVPVLHRPKRTAVSPVQEVDRTVRKEQTSTQAQTKFTERLNHSVCSTDSPLSLTSKVTLKDINLEQSSGSCDELLSSNKKHSMTLPASSGLMTRALKAEEETDLKDALVPNQISTHARTKDGPRTPSDLSTKSESYQILDSLAKASSSATHSSPKRRTRKPEKKQIRNGSLIESKTVWSSILTEKAVEIKTENILELPTSSLSSPSSSLSPMDAFQDTKELMFKSLVKEDSADSDLTAFRPNSNYKFSTFLMLLKDMHDTREKEGKPLTLPPSPVLFKEEPLVIPTATGGDLESHDGFTQGIKTESVQTRRGAIIQNRVAKSKNRTKAAATADTYHSADFPINSQIGNPDKQRRKQRLPAKLGVTGLSLDLADLAYGREYVSGHADLANPGPCPPGAANPSGLYLEKISGSKVAPKKRWQMGEENNMNRGEVRGKVSPEMNGSSSAAVSPDLDLDVEKQVESDSSFSETTCNAAGKTQTAAVKLLL